VCELRHGIVHSNCILAGKNAIKLKLEFRSGIVEINVEYSQLQECASICSTLVASFNTEMFEEMAKRWAVDWPKNEAWDSSKENSMFKKIWEAFHSIIDEQNRAISVPLTMTKCKNRVKKEFSA